MIGVGAKGYCFQWKHEATGDTVKKKTVIGKSPSNISLSCYHVMQTAPAKILMTILQSPKYSAPGIRTCERTIAPIEHPDWAIPMAVDLF